MAKTVNKLKPLQVKKEKNPGWYADGMGLYLQISKTGGKSWVYRYQHKGKERRHGLGSFPFVSLPDARHAAEECRLLRKESIDPIEYRKQLAIRKEQETKKRIT